MSGSFDAELERLVHRVAGELAEEIKNLLLRQLGIDVPARTPASGARRAAHSGRDGRPAALRRETRRRGGGGDRDATLDLVERAVAASQGASVGQLERQTGLSRATLVGALKTLKDEGRIFMGGTRRFARYATTQAAADRASREARGQGREPGGVAAS